VSKKLLAITMPDDFHVHLREGALLRTVAFHTSGVFRRALVMPNTTTPILTGMDAIAYSKRIMEAAGRAGHREFTPLMTIKLTDHTTPAMIKRAKEVGGVVAAKLYPIGVTTNSADGLSLTNLAHKNKDVFAAMEDCGMVLCVHGEMPGAPVLERESRALRELTILAECFPNLRIVLEHVSSSAGVQWVKGFQRNVGATITAHHLVLTLEDVIGNGINPHHFCKPIAKTHDDLVVLINAAIYDHRFFFGSDSAPHPRKKKECQGGAAGVFVPGQVAMSVVADVFERECSPDWWLTKFEEFMSLRGARFYGLAPNSERVTLHREHWKVPEVIGNVVPFRAGDVIKWTTVRA
jgi:dihydroorotase